MMSECSFYLANCCRASPPTHHCILGNVKPTEVWPVRSTIIYVCWYYVASKYNPFCEQEIPFRTMDGCIQTGEISLSEPRLLNLVWIESWIVRLVLEALISHKVLKICQTFPAKSFYGSSNFEMSRKALRMPLVDWLWTTGQTI